MFGALDQGLGYVFQLSDSKKTMVEMNEFDCLSQSVDIWLALIDARKQNADVQDRGGRCHAQFVCCST